MNEVITPNKKHVIQGEGMPISKVRKYSNKYLTPSRLQERKEI
jgi:hypothetical protein